MRVRVKLGSGASGVGTSCPQPGEFTPGSLRYLHYAGRAHFHTTWSRGKFEALTSAMQRRYRCCCLAPLTITESHKEPILTIHSSLRNRLLVFIVLMLA